MFQRDYILRLVEQLTQVLAQILFYKRTEQVEDWQQELDAAGRMLGQMDMKGLLQLNEASLLDLVTYDKALHVPTCLAVADLINEAGIYYENHPDLSLDAIARQKALLLYLNIWFEAQSAIRPLGLDQKILDLLDRIHNRHEPTPIRPTVMRFYESIGRFDKAEDVLFERVETREPNILETALQFYERLEAKTNDELRAGALPREELVEGRETIRHIIRKKI